MKARIYQDGHRVVLEYDVEDAVGEPMREQRVFVGKPGYYVRELLADGSTTQPCDGLASRGSTLICYGSLIDTIRCEWRRGQVAEQRYQASLSR